MTTTPNTKHIEIFLRAHKEYLVKQDARLRELTATSEELSDRLLDAATNQHRDIRRERAAIAAANVESVS